MLGDRTEKGRVPGLGRLRNRVARVGIWSRIVDRVLRRPLLSASLATGLLVAMAIPAIGMDIGTPNTSASLPQDKPVVQTFNRVQEAFPSETSSPDRRHQGQGRDGAAGRGRASRSSRRLRAQHTRPAPVERGRRSTSAPTRRSATLEVEIAGNGTDDAVEPGARGAPGRRRRPDDRHGRRRRGRTSAATRRRMRDFTDTLKSHIPYVLGVRALGGVPAAAGHVPLDRGPDQGDHPEPALRGRELRRDGAGVPARLVQEPARVHRDRPDHLLGPAVHVRGPVRPLDGLPRVHPQPGPRGRTTRA